MHGLVMVCEDQTRLGDARKLAETLGIDCYGADNPAPAAAFELRLTSRRLELHSHLSQTTGVLAMDFVGGALGHRLRYGGGRGQPLARAVGLKSGQSPTLIDATAGMGRDGFVLASLGCRVTLIERSPVIAALLQDALLRAAADEEIGSWVSQRLGLVTAEAIEFLNGLSGDEQRPEVVYLDPMYPHRRKSALVKKEMRIFRALAGDDPDASDLLTAALAAARKRVVVKRPKGAEMLGGQTPSHVIQSPNTRYDVYIVG